MKSLKYLSYIICAIFISGCTEKNISDNRIIIDAKKYQGTIALSKLCSRVTYTPLETSSTSLFGQIQKTRVSNHRLYFLSGYNQEKIIAFDRSTGDHVLTIDKIGEGPGEYVMATEFFVNPEDSCIEVYSRGLKKIIQYGSSGNFIEENKINDYINSFIKTENGYYLDVMRPNGKRAIVASTPDLSENQVLFDFKDYAWGDINGFSYFNGTISFGASLINTIYHISGTGFEIAYQFDFLEN
ncbi:MAG: 6-bladed beta-propeller, partial [Bacteroidales bacterium]